MSNSFDDNLYKIFAVEAGENLDSFEDALMKMESEGPDPAVVQEAFRLIHNIKGSAAMVGLAKVSELAHAMEDKLDQIRKGSLALEADLSNLLFSGIGRLRELIADPGLIEVPDVLEEVAALIGTLRGETFPKPPPAPSAPIEEPVLKPDKSIEDNPWNERDLVHVTVDMNDQVVFKDVKAYLVKTNLLEIGLVLRVMPPLEGDESPETTRYHFLIQSTADPATIRNRVERAAEIKNVSMEALSPSTVSAIRSIYEKDKKPEVPAIGIPALRKWGDRTFSVIVHRVSEMTNVVKFAGEMDGDGVVTLMDLFQESPSLIGNLILDFSKLNYINSLGLGFLIRLYKNVHEKGGRIQILAPSPQIKKLLENTKINSLIPIVATVDESVAPRGRG